MPLSENETNGKIEYKGNLHGDISSLFVYYQEQYLKKINNERPLFNWGMCEKNARKPMSQLGLEKMKELVDKYFGSTDNLYQENAYSLSCFLSMKTLHKLNAEVKPKTIKL